MLDINLVRDNPDLIKANETKRDRDESTVDRVLELDAKWRESKVAVEKLKALKNKTSQEINEAKKANDETTAKAKIVQMKEVAEQIKEQDEKTSTLLAQRDEQLLLLGNIMQQDVPYGKDDSENVELKKVGNIPSFDFKIKNHVELCEELDLADFESSATTSGNGFYFIKNELALLNQALIRFAIEYMHKQGYTYIEPPLMLRKDVLAAAVDMNELSQTIYGVADEELALIGTSEHALLGMHTSTCFVEKDLPKKYFSYSMCFRKEVGSHGINEKGLWRTHQFNKVEQFIFCSPEESAQMFDELLANSEGILKELGLPYRVIEICSGDLSLWKHKSYDVEVWRPTTNSYGEIMSLSNCTDYQARKLGIKVERKGNREVLHTLNNTALATSRIMVAILENCQTKEGTVKIPKVLVPYMQGIQEIKRK